MTNIIFTTKNIFFLNISPWPLPKCLFLINILKILMSKPIIIVYAYIILWFSKYIIPKTTAIHNINLSDKYTFISLHTIHKIIYANCCPYKTNITKSHSTTQLQCKFPTDHLTCDTSQRCSTCYIAINTYRDADGSPNTS